MRGKRGKKGGGVDLCPEVNRDHFRSLFFFLCLWGFFAYVDSAVNGTVISIIKKRKKVSAHILVIQV